MPEELERPDSRSPEKPSVGQGCDLAVTKGALAVVRALGHRRPDYYLQNRPNRPKSDIADYAESQGVLVPRRFASLEEALALPLRNCRRIILRSEHPQDYDGSSGDLPSWDIFRKDDGGFEVYGTYYEDGRSDQFYGGNYSTSAEILADYQTSLRTACEMRGLDPNPASFVVWEYVPGDNYAIVADSGLANRYHVYATINGVQIHEIVDAGKRGKTKSVHAKLIRQYENVRRLERFDPGNCPVMEFQHGRK